MVQLYIHNDILYMLDLDSVANKFVQQESKHQLRVINYSYCSLLAIVCVQVPLLQLYFICSYYQILSKYCEHDLIKCMLTLSDQSYSYCFLNPCHNFSYKYTFLFFTLEQDIVRQGIFEVIKFCGS